MKLKLPIINGFETEETEALTPAMTEELIQEFRALSVDDAVAETKDETSISIFGVIGVDPMTGADNTERRVAAALRNIGDRPVTVNLNSPGGSWARGTAIYNLLAQHSQEVTVNVLGMAGSAASVIMCGGDKVRVAKGSLVMIHCGSIIAAGNRFDMNSVVDYLKKVDDAMVEVYVARSGLAENRIRSMMEKNSGAGTFMSATEAVRLGFADEIATNIKEAKADASAKDASADVKKIIEKALMTTGLSAKDAKVMISSLTKGSRDAGSQTGSTGVTRDAAPAKGEREVTTRHVSVLEELAQNLKKLA